MTLSSNLKVPRVGQADFVVGLQYGDEGKGKIIDLLAADAHAVVRGNGGANAGHTIVLPSGQAAALHQLPSGVAYPSKLNVIAHGVLLDPVKLQEEIKDLSQKGVNVTPDTLVISDMAHLVLPKHKVLDAQREAGESAQGSTKAGIAFAASDKSLREGIRTSAIRTKSRQELWDKAYEGLKDFSDIDAKELADEFTNAARALVPYLKDTPALLNELLDSGHNLLVEGAQAFGLDVDHGKYPYSTSTGTTVPALLQGTGINPKRLGRVIGVAKAIPSKVGGGSFVTKITDEETAGTVRGTRDQVDGEYGATTGREREVGYLDLVQLKRAIQINGVDEIALTKFDCISRHGETTKVATSYERGDEKVLRTPPTSDEDLLQCRPVYEDLSTWSDMGSEEAEAYLRFIEEYLGTKVAIVSHGPERDQITLR